MSEHKTGKSNRTTEQKEGYWEGKKHIASLTPQQWRTLRRIMKVGWHWNRR